MRHLLVISLCFVSLNSHANVLQYFTSLSYSNPAELFKVKKNDFIIGGTGFYIDAQFTGSAINFNTLQYDQGNTHSRRASFLPYGRIAQRLYDKLVFGVDVTEPFHSNLKWGASAFSRFASTETLLTDVDLSPRFSFSLLPRFFVGAGLNFNFLKNNETNWAIPTGPTTYDTLINRTSGFGLGYNAGAYFVIDKMNFLGLTYYSAINQKTRGESFLGEFVSHDIKFDFHFPATTILNYVHIFTPKWLASFQIFRTEWNINQQARIRGTAVQPPLPQDFTFSLNYQESWAFSAAVRHQINEKTGLTLIGLADDGPERDRLRTINFPSDTQYFIALTADYRIGKLTTVELLYGHGFSNTRIHNSFSFNGDRRPFTTGDVKINADVIDLRIKIQA